MMEKLSILFLAACSIGFFSDAHAENPRSVSVSGVCLRQVIPDRGSISLVAEAKDADPKRSQVAAKRQYEAVRTRILALRLPNADLSTSEYVSEEIKEWQKDRMVSKGFRTRIGLRVETSDHARLGEAMEIGSRESIAEIGGLRLFVSSQKELEEKVLCLKEAAERAKTKADSLAKALGAQVGEVISIQEGSPTGNSEPPSPMPMLKAANASAMLAPPTLEAGKLEIATTIQATFRLR